ncbi:unnamed protein product [Schistosoma spindalis]|nr:unnamed protein product [Schistosoma spindale]
MQNETLALGVIKSVQKLYLEVQLPNGFLGRVNIYDVSDKYTELLRESAETGIIQDDLVELSDMFKVGQTVRCFIKEADNSRGSGSTKRYLVSLNPKMVNKAVISKHVKPHMVLVGSVVSLEDHGYILDSGVARINCFLPKDQIDVNPNIGSLIPFTPYVSDPVVDSSCKRVLKVTTRIDPTLSLLSPDSRVNFDCLLPGTCLHASIIKKVTSTLVAEFSEHFISISRTHYIGNKEDYQIGAKVVVCIILVDPSTKQLTGSLLPHLVNPIPSVLNISEMLSKCPVGTRFSGSLVERVNKRAVLVKLPKTNGLKAVIRIPKTGTKNSENFKSLVVGSKLTCRLTDHDFLENVAVATTNKKLLSVPFLSLHELKPGDKVSAAVKRYSKTGIVVHLEGRLHGLIPYLHTTDINLKDYREKFKAGEKISCLVLQLDKCANKLILTAKPGLLNTEFPIFGSHEMYSALKNGNNNQLLIVGFIVKVSDKGLLVSGLDNIRGWIPRRETGLADEDILQTNFYRGQVLKMKFKREINITSESKVEKDGQSIRSKYMLSLKFHSKETKNTQSIFLNSVQIGQLFRATVNQVQDTGISLNLYDNKNINNTVTPALGTGFLSFSQLSDYESNQQLLSRYVKNIKPGSTLNWDHSARDVVVIDKGKQTVILSARPTLIQAASDLKANTNIDVDMVDSEASDKRPGFLRTFDELQVGSQWFAWVSHHKDYGVFVHFPAGIYGLAPKHLLSDFRTQSNTSWSELYPVGATVITKIIEVTPEKRHCLISLKMFDIYNAKEYYVGEAIHSLNYYLTEREWISQKHELLGSFRIGDHVHFKVEELENSVIFGKASKLSEKNPTKQHTWVPAMVYVANSNNTDCVVSQTYSGIVCFIDHEKSRLEVVLSSWLVNSINTRKENISSCIKQKQQISSVVLAYRSRDIVVLGLRGHAAGLLGVVPARRTFNDVVGGNAWVIGQRNKITFRQSFQQESSSTKLQLCTLTIYDSIEDNQMETTSEKQNNSTSITNEENSGILNKSNLITFQAGQQISDLYFVSISAQTAFFAVGSIKGPHVYCHLINWDNTVKSIRAFSSHPPEVGTKIERIATVLFSYLDDKLILRRKNAGFRSKISEITFLDKPKVSVGQVVCAQVSRLKSDYWTVFLPGRASGRLHVTDMNYSDLDVKPLDLTETSNDSALPSSSSRIFNIHEHSNQIKAHYFITCRIVDQCQNVNTNSDDIFDVNDTSEIIYFVSNKVKLLRDPVESNTEQQSVNKLPDFDVPVDGFVKTVRPHGLVLCLSRTTDILVPFPPNLKNQLSICGIWFKAGDHLLVRPKRLINDNLVGELVCDNSNNCEHLSEDCMNELVKKLLSEVSTQKNTSESQKRELIFHDDLNETSNSLELMNCEPTSNAIPISKENILKQSKKKKTVTKTIKEHSAVTQQHDGSQSRKRRLTDLDESLNDGELFNAKSTFISKSSKKKQPRLEDETNLLSNESMNDVKIKVKSKKSNKSVNNIQSSFVSLNSDNIFSKNLLKRYEKFMYPDNENGFDDEMQTHKTLESTDPNNDEHLNIERNDKNESQAAKEWRLRDMEMRKAMLAELTTEQQYLPKGQLHPQSTEEFELAVRNMPSNEFCWIAYMTHVLSSKVDHQSINSSLNKGVIDARAIVERGLRAISNSTSNNQLTKQSRLLTSYLIMEAKELERLTCLQKQQQYHMSSSTSMSDIVIEINHQSKRVSQLLTQLLNLNQAPFIRKAIDTLSDIGHHTRAEELARRQIKSCPNDVDHWLSLIRVRFRAGNVEAAREAQRNSASLLKSSLLPQLAIGVARIEFEYGDVDRGIRLLQEQLTVHPKRKLLYEECIKLLIMNGKTKEARTVQQQAEKNLKPVQCTTLNSLFEGQVTC